MPLAQPLFLVLVSNSNAASNDTRNESQTRSCPAGFKAKSGTCCCAKFNHSGVSSSPLHLGILRELGIGAESQLSRA